MRPIQSTTYSPLWSHKSDEEIWAAIKNDDKDAFTYVYNKYIHCLYDYAKKLHFDDDLISEEIQNLFIEIWQHRKNKSTIKNTKFYLLKSLRYKIFRNITKGHKSGFLSLSYNPIEVEIVSPYEKSLIEHEVDEERKFKIASQISNLPGQQREIINLLFYQEYSYENISEIMGINIRSVYTLAWKAISRLRKKISE
ncbi:MAG: sigma-70 family RNA polymerase sigma factor [Cyclobacteriaceae bacterium]|nr:sigma-70 family RNA polymerase sigma factor [Cyclobacteriaceae bacterium]